MPFTHVDLDAQCASGICRSTDDKCGCTNNSHCPSNKVCHSGSLGDNKCYSSALSYGQSCAADGDALNSRCSSGFCRNADKTCGCTSNSHCPSNKVCKTSMNQCVTQQYRLSFNCGLGVVDTGTSSRVSLNVVRGGSAKVWIESMDKPSGCPDHTFGLAGGEADEYQIWIYGSDELGVDYFTLHDATNGDREIRRWGGDGGNGWCFSTNSISQCWTSAINGAYFPNRGVKLYKSGSSSERIRFSSGSLCDWHGACSSLKCELGGGSCGYTKYCCSVSIFKLLSYIVLYAI